MSLSKLTKEGLHKQYQISLTKESDLDFKLYRVPYKVFNPISILDLILDNYVQIRLNQLENNLSASCKKLKKDGKVVGWNRRSKAEREMKISMMESSEIITVRVKLSVFDDRKEVMSFNWSELAVSYIKYVN